jgi:hypothetical protein
VVALLDTNRISRATGCFLELGQSCVNLGDEKAERFDQSEHGGGMPRTFRFSLATLLKFTFHMFNSKIEWMARRCETINTVGT